MFQLQRAIIRPKTERSPGTFSDFALCGIPYSLQFNYIINHLLTYVNSNRQCLLKKTIPKYANIKIPYTFHATNITQKKIHTIRLKDEIEFLYEKKFN
jgi:hypothetical protein